MARITYDEPWPGLDENNKPVTCNRQITMTEEDIVKLMRYTYQHYKALPPEQYISEYMVVNWARKEKHD